MLYLLAFATVFYVAADHERLGGARWAAYSVGLSILFLLLAPNMTMLLFSQGALFALLWRVNVLKSAKHKRVMAEREKEMRADRRERLRRERKKLEKGHSAEAETE